MLLKVVGVRLMEHGGPHFKDEDVSATMMMMLFGVGINESQNRVT